MKIQSSHDSINYKAIDLRRLNPKMLCMRTVRKTQINRLKRVIDEQRENPVDIILSSKKGMFLKANLFCPYRLTDFKERYRQIPFIESSVDFIERVANAANKYKDQLLLQVKQYPENFPKEGVLRRK